jgi:hypothetical protein
METPEEPIWSSSKRTKLEQTLCEHPLQWRVRFHPTFRGSMPLHSPQR